MGQVLLKKLKNQRGFAGLSWVGDTPRVWRAGALWRRKPNLSGNMTYS